MAFECLDTYTDFLFNKIEKLDKEFETDEFLSKEQHERRYGYGKRQGFFDSAMEYYENVLKYPKWKAQRAYFESRLKKVDLSFYNGYFSKRKSTKT